MKQLKKALKGYAETKQAIDALNAELKRYQAVIENEMDNLNTDTITAGKYTAKRQDIEQQRFNSSAFKADYSALYDSYRKPVNVHRFSVTA